MEQHKNSNDEPPFCTEPLPLGQPLIENMDNIAKALAIAEGENYHWGDGTLPHVVSSTRSIREINSD